MKSMKKLVLGLLMCALMSAPAVATTTITPDDGLYRTYQEWTFGTNPGIGTGGSSPLTIPNIPADNGYTNGNEPKADVTLVMPYAYYDSYDAYPGVIYGSTATIDLRIPNIIDPDLTKIINVEIIYHVCNFEPGVHGYIDTSSYVEAEMTPLHRYDSISVNDTALADGWRDVTIEWRIPQIYLVEMVHLYLVDSGVAIDRIEVETICVPEPTTLLLFGGAAFVGWLRRRRTL
jgi:hypothetical protein